ncbi:MAG TPA: tyrosine-type recombinase/integrase, partial [Polyangiaceae bacterium]
MSLKRDRSGNYVCRFWTNGRGSRLVYENFGPISHKDASKREAALVAKWKARPASVDPRLTFGKLADLYVESKGARLSKRGRALAEMQLRCHLKPFFGEMRVEDIKAADVERYRAQRRQLVRRKGAAGRVTERTDLPVSPSTFNREWSFIRAILNFAERTERVDRNPIRRGAVEMLPTKPRSVFFEPAEWAAFIEAASADDELRRTVPALRLLLLTGSRIGEVAGLRWADVDLERRLLRVAQEKTRSSKTLPVAGAVAEILGSLVRGVPAAPLLIRAGGAPMTTAYLQVAFKRIRRRAKLDAGQHGKPTP